MPIPYYIPFVLIESVKTTIENWGENILKLHRIIVRTKFKSHLWVNLCMCGCVFNLFWIDLPSLIRHTVQKNLLEWESVFSNSFHRGVPRWFWVVCSHSKCAMCMQNNKNALQRKEKRNKTCKFWARTSSIYNWIDERFWNWYKKHYLMRRFLMKVRYELCTALFLQCHWRPFRFPQQIVFIPPFCLTKRNWTNFFPKFQLFLFLCVVLEEMG